MKRAFALSTVCLGLLVSAAPASAVTFSEGGDAGGTRETAAEINVSPLTAITGRIDPRSDRDLFRLCLTGERFTAETVSGSDPILGLFREDGTLVRQDDDSGPGFEARIDGTFGAGVFYLAVTSYANFSVNADTPGPGTGYHTFNYTVNVTGANQCLPTSAEQCKNGGFMDFGGRFKNQGDCVSFVQTDGKNEPGKNQPNP